MTAIIQIKTINILSTFQNPEDQVAQGNNFYSCFIWL
jgi:hypothetical protein